jgi:hypothetical protein
MRKPNKLSDSTLPLTAFLPVSRSAVPSDAELVFRRDHLLANERRQCFGASMRNRGSAIVKARPGDSFSPDAFPLHNQNEAGRPWYASS